MYSYDEELTAAIYGYLEENCEDMDEDYWFEELELSDAVTGNASGSFFCNRGLARRCVMDNVELFQEVLESMDASMQIQMVEYFINDDWESLDVIIRLYVFSHVFPCVWAEWVERCNGKEVVSHED